MVRTKNLAVAQSRQSEQAKAELEKEGLLLRPKPKYEIPPLPTKLSELDDDTLMNLFARLTNWADHLNGALAAAMVDERSVEASVAVAEATALIRDWGGAKEDRVTLARAQRDLDPTVQAMKDELAVAYARRKFIEAMFTNAERDSAVVSRELTRRVGRIETNDRRLSRWTP